MSKQISHSAYNKYVTCPHLYNLHYVERIRPIKTQSHLVFGSAMDAGLNDIMQGKNTELQSASKELDRLLTEPVQFKPSEDYDHELLTDEQKATLSKQCEAFGYKGDKTVDELAAILFEKEELSEGQTKVLATLVRACMLEKAKLMLAGFRAEMMPKIEKVIGVQVPCGSGFADMVVKLKGDDQLYIGDNKTAGNWAVRNVYTEDAIQWSIQLADYANHQNATKGLYFVFEKQIRKNRIRTCVECGHVATGRHKTCENEIESSDGEKIRCNGDWGETIQPEAVIRPILGDIPASLKSNVAQAKLDVQKGVEQCVFPRNLNACKNQFGKPCVYLGLCWEGKMDGLRKVEKSND